MKDLDFELKKLVAQFTEFYRLLEDKSDYRLVIKYNRLNNEWRHMGGLNEFELLADTFWFKQQDLIKEQEERGKIAKGNGVQFITDENLHRM